MKYLEFCLLCIKTVFGAFMIAVAIWSIPYVLFDVHQTQERDRVMSEAWHRINNEDDHKDYKARIDNQFLFISKDAYLESCEAVWTGTESEARCMWATNGPATGQLVGKEGDYVIEDWGIGDSGKYDVVHLQPIPLHDTVMPYTATKEHQ